MSADLWEDTPEIRKRYIEVLDRMRRLQAELGLEPKTIEQRAQELKVRKAAEAQAAEFRSTIKARPKPVWKHKL